MPSVSYVLTPTAKKHLREAKAWSKTRWRDTMTAEYFLDLHQDAQYLAEHHTYNDDRPDLAGNSGLGV